MNEQEKQLLLKDFSGRLPYNDNIVGATYSEGKNKRNKMGKIIYENTGKFTKKQIKLCEEISEKLKELRKSGCSVLGKGDRLEVYLSKELRYSNLVNYGKSYTNEYPIPHLDAGDINDSGADDTEFFIDECLDFETNEEDF